MKSELNASSSWSLVLLVVCVTCLVACGNPSVPGSPGVPEPIKVLENPANGQRARFFREITFKVPKGYSESKHLAEWALKMEQEGFTKEISPENDRAQWAALRARNRAQSGAAQPVQ